MPQTALFYIYFSFNLNNPEKQPLEEETKAQRHWAELDPDSGIKELMLTCVLVET